MVMLMLALSTYTPKIARLSVSISMNGLELLVVATCCDVIAASKSQCFLDVEMGLRWDRLYMHVEMMDKIHQQTIYLNKIWDGEFDLFL